MSVREDIRNLKERVSAQIIGQQEIVDRLILGLLANGNLLVEGLPGLAKTRAVKALADNIESDFNRIQFTPDLSARDITGYEEHYPGKDGETQDFKFIPGPIFANIVLADEINRAPSKVQNTLLEAMEERQVTVSAVSHKMPDLFMVMATQNPANQEGTYPLPEAQMDRFLMHFTIDYPDEESEARVIRLVRDEQTSTDKNVESGDKKSKTGQSRKDETTKTSQETIFKARQEINDVKVPEDVEKYMVDLVFATRYPERYSYELKSFIDYGASPRASLALDKCARADAWFRGRDAVNAENVRNIVYAVLRHRISPGERAEKHNVSTDELIEDILEYVEAPS